MYSIILASESPRRKEILERMGIPYETIPSHVLEVVSETSPSDMVIALASLKAKDVASRIKEKDFKDKKKLIIIGADTIVFHKGQALGKPKDRNDAIKILNSLSGDAHEVKTGVCIIIRDLTTCSEDEIITFDVSTQVIVQPLTSQQIEDYVDTGEPMDKAGAYGIQGGFGIYIKEIHGDYYNIVGFPIAKIHEKLLSYGIRIK